MKKNNLNLGPFAKLKAQNSYAKATCYGTWAIFAILLCGFLLNAFTVGMAIDMAKRVPQKIGGMK